MGDGEGASPGLSYKPASVFWGNNTLTDWNKNEKQLKTKGEQNWEKIEL